MKRLSKSWEQLAGRRFGALRPDSIRYKMLFFAVVVTLVPSLATAWVSYFQNKNALTEKITADLVSVSGAVSRELDLWLKSNLYNLRVFASSYEVTENIERAGRPGPNLSRLTDYLRSLRSRFPDEFDELLVVDPRGTPVATHAGARLASARTGMQGYLRDSVPPDTLSALVGKAGAALEYRGFDGQGAVGSYQEVPRLRWAVVSEVPTVRAYQQVIHLRNVTVGIVLGLLAVIGAIAYFLSMLIVRPLNRLAQAAGKVAA